MYLTAPALPAPDFRKKPQTLKKLITGACLGAGLTSFPAHSAEVEEIIVVDRQQESYRFDQSTLDKFTESLRDTPQTITLVTGELMQDRGALTLDDALRNVPGITLGAGEFSWQGNNPSIRGFSSRNDMFLDGMRDFGNYYRDPFNLEAVEVLQGPSSMVFGRGSTGGVINQSSKTPLPDPLRSLHINVGNADTRRITADINQPLESLGENAAVRLNLLNHESEVAGRDGATADHYGIAPSLSLGLGSATRLTLSYLKQHGENTPDYGLPWIAGEPAKVPRETFYGFDSDHVNTDADIATLRLDHNLNSAFTGNVKLRYADYYRDSRITEPLVAPSVTAATPLDAVTVNRNVFIGESTERMFQGQVNLFADLIIGGMEHALVGGLEVSNESSSPSFGFGVGVPSTPLLNPVEEPFTAASTAMRLRADTNGDSLAAYILDTVKLGEHWQVVAGLRWDRFDTNYIAHRFAVDGTPSSSEQIIRTDIETSYRAALVYKPVEEGTFYLGWGTSFNPSSEGLSFINSGRNLTIGDANLAPETNRSVEVGTKWDLFGGGLFLESSLFRIVKANARVPDPNNPGFNILAGEQQVDGVSLNLSGRLGPVDVSGGYTYLDSEQKETTQASVPPDSPLQNVAENTFSFWLNYRATDRLQIGGGTRYVDERLATITLPVKSIPDYWTFDAMVKYEATESLTFKLNLTNLTDEVYFDQPHPFHVIPGPGFTSVFAVNFDY